MLNYVQRHSSGLKLKDTSRNPSSHTHTRWEWADASLCFCGVCGRHNMNVNEDLKTSCSKIKSACGWIYNVQTWKRWGNPHHKFQVAHWNVQNVSIQTTHSETEGSEPSHPPRSRTALNDTRAVTRRAAPQRGSQQGSVRTSVYEAFCPLYTPVKTQRRGLLMAL